MSIEDLLYPNGDRLDDRDGHGVAELLVELRIRQRQLVAVGKTLQARPFARRHLADILRVDAALDARHWHHGVLPVVDDQVALAAHATAHNGAGDAVEVPDLVAEAVSERFVMGPVAPKRLHVGVRKIVFRTDRGRLP